MADLEAHGRGVNLQFHFGYLFRQERTHEFHPSELAWRVAFRPQCLQDMVEDDHARDDGVARKMAWQAGVVRVDAKLLVPERGHFGARRLAAKAGPTAAARWQKWKKCR